MNSEMIEKYFIANNKVLPVSEVGALSAGSSRTIYEVIRIISGVPLFLEKHLSRMEASAKLMGYTGKLISDKIQNSIFELIKTNNNPDKNVKIIVYNLENNTPDYMAYFIQSSYPTPEDYIKGVHGILLSEERANPNAKVVNSSFKERVANALTHAKAHEALLVNSENEITEGSRSNVFFVKNGKVLTAQKGNVLIGITRVCVFELCKNLGIEIIEKTISASILSEMDGVLMTGTSPKLLPISTIDDMSFSSADNPVIKALITGYDDMIEEYVRNRRKCPA